MTQSDKTISELKAENERLKRQRDDLHEANNRYLERARTAEARARALEEALYWALGEGPEDDFPSRGDGEGMFWWRTELRRRCGLPVRVRALTEANSHEG